MTSQLTLQAKRAPPTKTVIHQPVSLSLLVNGGGSEAVSEQQRFADSLARRRMSHAHLQLLTAHSRWCYLACHPGLWLRVDRFVKYSSEPGVFPNIEAAVSAARPGDTIMIASGGSHCASNIQIKVPLCLIGGGDRPDDTVLECFRGSDSALEFLSTCKISNLTVKAELGCCLLHRRGRLIIERCILQCDENPLDYLSCAIVSTADVVDSYSVAAATAAASVATKGGSINSVSVSRTQIEGGAKAVSTSGSLVLQRVRVICTRAALLFWFDIE